jgi:hypothetical protein
LDRLRLRFKACSRVFVFVDICFAFGLVNVLILGLAFELFLLAADVFLLDFFAFLFEITLVLHAVKLLPHFSSSAFLVSMEDNVASAKTFFNLHEPETKAWTELVQSNGNLTVLLLILIVVWQNNLGTW